MWPLASRTGTVSVKVPVPCRRHTSVTGGVGREELGELGDAAVVDEDLLVRTVLPRRARQAALVADDEGQPGDEERGLAGPGDAGRRSRSSASLRKICVVGPVAHPGAGDAALGLADDRELAVVARRA